MQALPNLFIVGAPKSGTSSLYELLKSHEDIYMCPKKEPGFFCQDFWEESDNYQGRQLFFKYRTEAEYLDLFRGTENFVYRGEASSKYLYSRVAARLIKDFNPNAKIIVSLREPFSFLRSYHSQCLYDLVEDEPSFERALELETDRKNGRSIPSKSMVPSYAFYSEISRFSEQVQRYQTCFHKDQIHFIVFEELHQNTQSTIQALSNFLELESLRSYELKAVNKNKQIKNLKLHASIKHATKSRFSRSLLQIIPEPIRLSIIDGLLKRNYQTQSRARLDPNLEHRLKKNYYEEVARLSELLDKDLLSLWNYDKL